MKLVLLADGRTCGVAGRAPMDYRDSKPSVWNPEAFPLAEA